MVSIKASDLGMWFGQNLLFRNLSFSVEGGEMCVVRGPNGSGKSTLLRILAGLLQQERGTVSLSLDGVDKGRADRRLLTGMVAPGFNLYEVLSLRENLEFIQQARSIGQADRKTDALLERVGLADRADDQIRDFSSGMKQRCRLAAGLVSDPAILVFDEPYANLDSNGVALVDRTIEEHLAKQRPVVVASHVEALISRGNQTIDLT